MLPMFGRADAPALDSSFLSGIPAGFTFTRASQKIASDAGGVLRTFANDVPAIGYDPSDGSLPGIVLEPSSTNLLLYSEQGDNAAWTNARCTITADTATSPAGTTTAETMTEDASTGAHTQFQSVIKAASPLTYTYSRFVKSGSGSRNIQVRISSSAGGFARVGFSQADGSIVLAAAAASGFTNVAAASKSYGNGWFRVSITATTDSDTVLNCETWLLSGTTNSYAGDGASSILLWGAQLELGAAYPSSYIATTATTATRAADNLTLALPYAGSPGATAWTAALEFVPLALLSNVISLRFASSASDATYSLFAANGSGLVAKTVSGSSIFSSYTANALTTGLVAELALSQDTADARMVLNAGAVVAATKAGYPDMTSLAIGRGGSSNYQPMRARRLRLWPRKLSDAELQAVTL